MARVLLALPSMAAAFLHSTITTHPRVIHRNQIMPSDSTFTTIHSSIRDDQHPTMGEGASKTHSQIIKLLMERQHQLHSDISKLQEQHPQSTIAADNDMHHLNITTEQMVHEALLSTRLPLPFLNRTKLGPSTIDGAGRGLFATEDISEGEIITCYPCDALLYELPGNDDYNENEEDEGTESIVLWGAHVPKNDRWDEDAVFDGTESTPSLIAYAVSIGDHYSVMGHPDLDDNPAYYGHFVNDGAGHLALEETNSERNIQADRKSVV